MSNLKEMANSGLSPQYQAYEKQKCFIGHSRGARWRTDIESVCQEVLQGEFNLEPWYADEHPDPTKILRDKVVEMIANTRYGIYDLSYWRKDDKSDWVMPRNVLIELGVAIALNRPALLLRHAENETAGLKLPVYLESVSDHILEFSGKMTLKRAFREHIPQWINVPPERDWWNLYCFFGQRICEYREAYPFARQWGQEVLGCHISDGQDKDRPDFRGIVEEVLDCYSDLAFEYLDGLSITKGYDFLFCTLCQKVRSTPFAIYRITSRTPAETFLAIGMSLALEKQFNHEIPKILLTENVLDVPSLLLGYEVVEAQNDTERKTGLQKFVPVVIQKARKTTWKPRPLPFKVVTLSQSPHKDFPKNGEQEQENAPRDTESIIQEGSTSTTPADIGYEKVTTLEEITYEGYGPGGVAVLVEASTENRNRTVAEVRNAFGRNGGQLGENGSVDWLFESKGIIEVELKGQDADELTLEAIDLGADDVDPVGTDDEVLTIYTDPSDLEKIRKDLEAKKYNVVRAGSALIPKTKIELSDERVAHQLMRMVERLENLDDVRKVYTNADYLKKFIASYTG